jgi:hypothetical protein
MPILEGLDELIDELGIPGGLMVERSAQAVQNDHGGWTPQPAVLMHFNPIAAHSVTGDALQELPEATRIAGAVAFYTKTPLYAQTSGKAADVVRYQGQRFKIVDVVDHELQAGAWISTGQRQDPQS